MRKSKIIIFFLLAFMLNATCLFAQSNMGAKENIDFIKKYRKKFTIQAKNINELVKVTHNSFDKSMCLLLGEIALHYTDVLEHLEDLLFIHSKIDNKANKVVLEKVIKKRIIRILEDIDNLISQINSCISVIEESQALTVSANELKKNIKEVQEKLIFMK